MRLPVEQGCEVFKYLIYSCRLSAYKTIGAGELWDTRSCLASHNNRCVRFECKVCAECWSSADMCSCYDEDGILRTTQKQCAQQPLSRTEEPDPRGFGQFLTSDISAAKLGFAGAGRDERYQHIVSLLFFIFSLCGLALQLEDSQISEGLKDEGINLWHWPLAAFQLLMVSRVAAGNNLLRATGTHKVKSHRLQV